MGVLPGHIQCDGCPLLTRVKLEGHAGLQALSELSQMS